MLVDGTQDPAQECNAISFGIGFTARISNVGAAAVVKTNTCGG